LPFDGDVAARWCKLVPRAQLEWLVPARCLQLLDDLPVWSILCFFVRRAHRHHGVMGALIDAAVGVAASAGAPAVEA